MYNKGVLLKTYDEDETYSVQYNKDPKFTNCRIFNMRGISHMILSTDNSELIQFSISSEPWILTMSYGVLILISLLISLSGFIYRAYKNGHLFFSTDLLMKPIIENYMYLVIYKSRFYDLFIKKMDIKKCSHKLSKLTKNYNFRTERYQTSRTHCN